MHEAVYWVGFAGSWLLFAGPLYQSALELREEEEARLSMQRLLQNRDLPDRVSPWWWLLPPVAIVLLFRQRAEQFRVIDAAMSEDDRRAIGHYRDVARGWGYVGAGAWCIFLKETWELAEHNEWTQPVYWGLVVFLTLSAIGGAGATGDRGSRRRPRRPPGRPATT